MRCSVLVSGSPPVADAWRRRIDNKMRKMLEVRPSGRLDTPEARHARSGPGRTFLSPGLWLMRQSGWGCGPIDDEQRRRLVRKRSAANSLEEFLSRWLLPRSAPSASVRLSDASSAVTAVFFFLSIPVSYVSLRLFSLLTV